MRGGASEQGLGLGLYICAEIARAHGGTLVATSTPERTTFLFRMPAEASGIGGGLQRAVAPGLSVGARHG